ncbi:protein of unknown function [Fodinibius roseus]|uniref:DUF3857 domain-containing protein n=1 Tax=Fodinibius roseus TaxID=1194090 RepID=A0A1M5GFK3_9BACT|nr:DUF3857 domain-containing protein [Fodinibius roseus]SHG02476.1 protein of unknown function [Fodinibius roseus]
MVRFITLITFFCCISSGFAGAQDDVIDAQYGVIPDSLFRMQEPADKSETPYTITNKEVDVSFQETGGSIIAVLRHHMRLKVFDASSPEASTVTIPYYFADNMEQISDIRGTTHRSPGEQVPLDNAEIKTIDINGRYKVKEFAMPAVEDGAVLEYSYVIRRRYIEELPDFHLSQRVPTAHAKMTITYPPYLRYESVVEQYEGPLHHDFAYRDTSSVPKIFTLPRPDPVITERWIASDIPPVKEEPFISSLDDYRGKIKFILKAFGLPRQQLDTGWDVVVAKLRRNTNPLEQIRTYRRARALGDSLSSEHPEDSRRALQARIYRYLNERVRFSGAYAPYSTTPDSAVLAGTATDQAAINQTLLAMLRGAGIEAHPLLASTRSSGTINRAFPSFYQFNALAVRSEIEGEAHIMDASFPYGQPNLIPVEMNNGEGLLLRDDSFSWVPMQAGENMVGIQVGVEGQLQANGTLSGAIVSHQRGYPAQIIRQQKADGQSDAEVLRQTIFDGYSQVSVSDVRITNLNSYEEPVEIRAGFEIERYATSYTDGLRFRPMLVGYQMENPFEDSDRDLPVTLNAPEHVQVSYDIALPRGFAAASGRESHTLDLPGAVFEESYDMQTGKLNYEYTIDIGRQHFPVEQFDQLYRVYERWVELSNSYWLIES